MAGERKIEAEIEIDASPEAVWEAQICNEYLRKHTIEPHSQTSGTFMADAARSDHYRIQVVMGADKHVFDLSKPDRKR